MSISILHTIDSGTSQGTHHFPTSTGFDYRGGKSTFAFSGTDFSNVTHIKIQANFDGVATNWIDLTDSADNAVEVDGQTILTVDIGKCKLRFLTAVGSGGTQSDINITVS